jgi:hypothetical protein
MYFPLPLLHNPDIYDELRVLQRFELQYSASAGRIQAKAPVNDLNIMRRMYAEKNMV